MTKLFISADLEGACGVTSPLHCFPERDRPGYERAVSALVQEVNAVVSAAFDAGATEIVVNDAHGYMTNLPVAALSPRVRLLSGKPKACAMSAGLDESFDGVLFVGYHAKAGTTAGILNHTFHDKLFDVSVNGVSYGESGINALYASLEFGVPVILASGDQALREEVHSFLPAMETIQTKTSLSFSAALNRPLEDVLAEYRQKVTALMQAPESWRQNLLTLEPPYTLQVTFINSLAADVAMTLPWLNRLDGRTVSFETERFQTVYQALQSCYAILSYSAYME